MARVLAGEAGRVSEAVGLDRAVGLGRQVRRDKRGAIPEDLSPILDRLKVDAEMWVASVENFGR